MSWVERVQSWCRRQRWTWAGERVLTREAVALRRAVQQRQGRLISCSVRPHGIMRAEEVGERGQRPGELGRWAPGECSQAFRRAGSPAGRGVAKRGKLRR